MSEHDTFADFRRCLRAGDERVAAEPAAWATARLGGHQPIGYSAELGGAPEDCAHFLSGSARATRLISRKGQSPASAQEAGSRSGLDRQAARGGGGPSIPAFDARVRVVRVNVSFWLASKVPFDHSRVLAHRYSYRP